MLMFCYDLTIVLITKKINNFYLVFYFTFRKFLI
jgi:hypothetical protein